MSVVGCVPLLSFSDTTAQIDHASIHLGAPRSHPYFVEMMALVRQLLDMAVFSINHFDTDAATRNVKLEHG